MTEDEVREVQDRVNAAIWADLPVRKESMPYDEAIREGAMALFGEKYGDTVRVVSMGDWSKELCGGTHVDATGEIGLVLVTGETGIGSGIRRVEAVAGAAAYMYVHQLREQLANVAAALQTPLDNAVTRAQQLAGQVHEQEKRIGSLSRKLAQVEAEGLVRAARPVDDVSVVAARINTDEPEYLKDLSDAVRSRLDRGIVFLAAQVNGNAAFTVSVPKALNAEGYDAGTLLREVLDGRGRGGGRAGFAQGVGDASAIPAVLEGVVDVVRRKAETKD
jgi:alanyl-tRNA synthetase